MAVAANGGQAPEEGGLYVVVATGALCPLHYMHVQMLEDARSFLVANDPSASVVAGYVVGCWLLVVGCWLLVVGCWLLVVGWLFGYWHHWHRCMHYWSRSLESCLCSIESDRVCADRYLSPTHDAYVGSKLRAQGLTGIEGRHRAAMINTVLQHSDWLRASLWEIEQPGFVDFPDVTAWHRRYLKDLVAQRFSPAVADRVKVLYVCGADHAARCGLNRTEIEHSW
jgi:hypothetical protein